MEGLFAGNPFPERPPRFIRAVLYDYRMTDRETRRRTGEWWTRELTGLYLPPVSLAPPGATHRLEWAAEA
ncbi:lipase maturation factor family protein [Cystobacter fuscus]